MRVRSLVCREHGISSCGNTASRLGGILDCRAQLGKGNGLAHTVAHANLLVHLTLGCAVASCDCDNGHLLVGLKDGMLGRSLADRGCGLDACEVRHVNVHQDEVDFFLAKPLKGINARGHHCGNLDCIGKVMLEHAGEDGEVNIVVINDHDLDLAVGQL